MTCALMYSSAVGVFLFSSSGSFAQVACSFQGKAQYGGWFVCGRFCCGAFILHA